MPEPGRADGLASSRGTERRAAGALEAAVLDILRAVGEPLSAGEVRDRINVGDQRDLSYSTVVTIISRLHDKGLLARQRSGRGFAYTPVDEANLAASRMSSALGNGIDRDAVLSRFVSGLSERDARLLRTLLADAREPAADGRSQSRERD